MQFEISIRDIQHQVQIQTYQKDFDKKIENLNDIQCQSQVDLAKFKQSDKSSMANIADFTKDCQEKLSSLTQERSKLVTHMMGQTSAQDDQNQLQLCKLRKYRQSALNKYKLEMDDSMSRLTKAIEKERLQKEDSIRALEARLRQDVQHVREKIIVEAHAQEVAHDNLIKSIEDVQKQVMRDLCAEASERESVETGFINLLEQTCERIERNIAHWV